MAHDPLIQDFYISTSKLAGSYHDQAMALQGIVDSSQKHNLESDVTGVLLFTGGYFAQVLEGPESEVLTTIERIQADGRHTDIIEMVREPITERNYAPWSMTVVISDDESLTQSLRRCYTTIPYDTTEAAHALMQRMVEETHSFYSLVDESL